MQPQRKIPEEVFQKHICKAYLHICMKISAWSYDASVCEIWSRSILMKLRTSSKLQKLQKNKDFAGVFHKDCLSRHNTLHEHILVTFYGILIRGVFRTQSNMQDGALSFTHMFTVLWIRLCWSLRICQW